MDITIRVAGKAGLGMNSTADMIAQIFAKFGYEVITDIEYQSLIKGGFNYFDIFVSKESKYLTKRVDFLVCLDIDNLQKFASDLRNGGFLISSKKNFDKLETKGETFENYKKIPVETFGKYDNIFLVSAFCKIIGLEKEFLLGEVENIFAKKGEEVIQMNKTFVKNIYENSENFENFEKSEFQIEKIGKEKRLEYGNWALAFGAIESGLEYYSAYPMTPASSILTEVIKSGKVKYLQAEDEIAVINSALGASFIGARSMVGTSGGGFALMTEALSFAIQAEIPITCILSQRAGPSTGTPTFLETGDLNFALNPTFGDFEHIVLSPSTLEQGFYFSGESLNLAKKYQIPVIMLSDKQFADGNVTLDEELKPAEINNGKILENPPEDYKRYEFTEDGISPMVKVGTKNGDFIATSYEHDEFGATSEDSENKKLMTEKRAKKLKNFFEKENIFGFEIHNEKAEKIIILNGFSIYTAKEFIRRNPEFGILDIRFFKPLDPRIRDFLITKKEIIFVESNFSGQMENYITKEFGLNYVNSLKIRNLRKYDLMPFYLEDFETLI